MKAMILAAGRGQRLRPLTDRLPKPLIPIHGQPLIGHHLQALAAAGVTEVVINIAYRAKQIRQALGDGRDYGVRISYSPEQPGQLDTGGGVANALPLLGPESFLLVSADILTDMDYAHWVAKHRHAKAHIALVANPVHKQSGDFGLYQGQVVDAPPYFTYAGIGVFDPDWFARPHTSSFPLSQVLHQALNQGVLTGEYYPGRWLDVGRPLTLAQARQRF